MNSIEESFFIDPTLRLPQALLPSLKAGETEDTRRNLSIDMTMGSIDVDVTIVYNEGFSQSSETKRRVILVVKCTLGSINMRLVCLRRLHHYPLELNFGIACSGLTQPTSFVPSCVLKSRLDRAFASAFICRIDHYSFWPRGCRTFQTSFTVCHTVGRCRKRWQEVLYWRSLEFVQQQCKRLEWGRSPHRGQPRHSISET